MQQHVRCAKSAVHRCVSDDTDSGWLCMCMWLKNSTAVAAEVTDFTHCPQGIPTGHLHRASIQALYK